MHLFIIVVVQPNRKVRLFLTKQFNFVALPVRKLQPAKPDPHKHKDRLDGISPALIHQF